MMPRKDKSRSERGPALTEDVCIGEDVKIGIHLAVERFRLDATKEELAFPTSLSTTERAYVHRYCEKLGGLKTRSRGNGQNRYITVTKHNKAKGKWTPDLLSFSRNELGYVTQLLQRFPVNDRERDDLTPVVKKRASTHDGSKDKSSQGRLVGSPAQVPPKRSASDLNKFRQSLPVFKMGPNIIETINSNKVCLIAGETGSGKTTQVPQLILDDCHEKKRPCRILCTQPRRIAAVTIAERVAAERGEKIGGTVGYQIRLESKVSSKTVLTFCTAGVVLRNLVGTESNLGTVTHVVVDEVHERDKFVDFLLLCLREVLEKHPNLRLILMSATLNMELFSEYFDNCPIICVPGSLHDVEEYFLEDILKWTNYKSREMNKALEKSKSAKKTEDLLSEWFSVKDATSGETLDSDFEDDSDVTTSDNVEELGEEKENLDPAVKKEMDDLLQEVWLSGNKELFHKILLLISSEHISVDYEQSESGVTALMIAAGRGFVDIVEHLLDLGANFNVKTNHEWTAIDFAKQFEQQEIVELLQAYALASESRLASAKDEDMELISAEDRELLSAYQHSFDDEKVDTDLITELILKLHFDCKEGAILVFLPGYEDIMTVHGKIIHDERFASKKNTFLLFTLHSSIQASEQKKVFRATSKGVRKIILSTNIAETSVTINDVVYVIDSGKVKEKTFDALSNFSTLNSNWISKASALQRKGRAGRCQAGKCYHLFSRGRYVHLQDYPTPEILRLPLQEVCLHTKLLAPNTETITGFLSKCPQAPPPLVIINAVQLLKEIDALDPWEELTELGQHLVDLPVEPKLGKMVLYAVVLKCLDPVLTIVCTMAHREPFILPTQPYMRRNVLGIRRKLAEQTYSDHFVFLRAFQLWQKARLDGREYEFCDKYSVSSATMHMLVGMRMQILHQLKLSGFLRTQGALGGVRDLNANADNWAVVKACLVAGTYPNIIQKATPTSLNTRKDSHVRFQNTSVIGPVLRANHGSYKRLLLKTIKDMPSRWVIYDEMSRAGRFSQARGCTLVSALSVFLFGGPSKVPKNAMKDKVDPESDGDEPKTADDLGGIMKVFRPDDWLTFHCSSMDGAAGLELRMKLHSLFLTRIKYPHRPWTQADEATLQTVTSLLTNADAVIGLTNPIGVGQRPKQMVLESVVGHGVEEYYGSQYHHHQQQRLAPHHGYNTGHSRGGGDEVSDQTRDSCFFIMKAANHKLLEISQTKNFWATSTGHEGKLSKAYMSGRVVYLIFSVQGSGHFQGFAKMTSSIARTKSPDFPSPGLSAIFSVEWLKSAHLPFQLCHHLLNPWNENKKVQESRDGQELEAHVGSQLLKLWDKFHHQLKPFKLGQSHRQRSLDTPPPTQQQQQKGHRGQTSQRQAQVKLQQRGKDRQGEAGSTPSEGNSGGEDASSVGSKKKMDRKDSDCSSPAPSTNSNEGSNSSRDSPAHLSHRLRQLSTESSQSESSSQGLLGEPPSGLMPFPGVSLSAQQNANTGATAASYSLFLQQQQQQQQQQAFALAQQGYVGARLNPFLVPQGGMMGQGIMMNPQAALQRVMMLPRGHPQAGMQQQQPPHYSDGGHHQPQQ
ncbi:3'-5' RNA helicase YTHDC2 [Aplysia californica]|uniref:3'-5' RNA helicase YTHDC2 n=1 Tax=Aplysia californica TaxID=6500 RepID=A0ABM0JBA1_APLCA|nr:3'-5' RNA helicase YTHDC2 [Aplysia californica]